MQQLVAGADCLSNLALDEWLAGELDASAQQRCDRHLAHCPACQARRAQFEREAAQFYAEAPSFIRQPPAAGSRLRGRGWIVAGMAVAALAASVALVVWPDVPELRTRAKGS